MGPQACRSLEKTPIHLGRTCLEGWNPLPHSGCLSLELWKRDPRELLPKVKSQGFSKFLDSSFLSSLLLCCTVITTMVKFKGKVGPHRDLGEELGEGGPEDPW